MQEQPTRQLLAELPHGCWTRRRILVQAGEHDARQVSVDARTRWKGRWLASENGIEDGLRAFAPEGQLAADHFVEQDAERPDVAREIDLVATRLLGRHVTRAAEHDA